MANPMILDSFEGDVSAWQYVSDRVMGGVSDGQAALGQDGNDTYARLTGAVSTANNGGFVQIRRALPATVPEGSKGITLTTRGNGEVYYVHLRTTASRRPWQYYRATFPTTANWEEVTLDWSDFEPAGGLTAPLSVTDIRSIGIVAYGRDHQADVSVSTIRFDR